VNAPARVDSTPRLEDFPYRLTDNVRFADLDPNQHVNNAVYASYFETGRVTLMKDRSYGLLPDGVTWIMVRLDMHFRAELRWPGTIDGTWRRKFGRTPSPSNGGVLRGHSGFAVGVGAAGRGDARRAVDRRYCGVSSPGCTAASTANDPPRWRHCWPCYRGAAAAADPFHREDLRILMALPVPAG
jgi:hypothetical protein